MVFDGVEEDAGIGGTTNRPTSQDNDLEIGGLRWYHEGLMFIEKQLDSADGIIGFNVFEDKLVEVDYDRKVILVHDSPPPYLKRYQKIETRLQGTLPGIRATLETGQATVTDWFIVDTGSSSDLRLNYAFAEKHKLPHTMRTLGASILGGVGKNKIRSDVVLLPELRIGSVRLSEIPVDLSSSPEAFSSESNLGMGILKRFNTIFDFRKDQIYLQPNSLIAEPFPRHRRTPNVAFLSMFLITLFGLMALLRVVLRKKARDS